MPSPAKTAVLSFALLFSLQACSKEEPVVTPSTSPPTTSAPSANAPATGHFLNFTNAVDLSQVKNQEMIHPDFSLTPPDVDSPIFFAQVENEDAKQSVPVFLKKIGTLWKIIEVAEAQHQQWAYAAACPTRHELWALLDGNPGTPTAQMTFLRSTDDGLSWQFFSAVKKPTPDADYAGFSLAANGIGRLSMHLDDDASPFLHGYYHYTTTDGGKNWTGPTFEGDDILEADTVKDLDTLQEAIHSTEGATTNP